MHVVVLTQTRLCNTLQSVVTGQAPTTLDRKISSGGKQMKQKKTHIFSTHHPPPTCISLLSHALGAEGGGVPSSVRQSSFVNTLTTYVHTNVKKTSTTTTTNTYMLPGTPYVRHKRYVRLHIAIPIVQVIIWYFYIPYILELI